MMYVLKKIVYCLFSANEPFFYNNNKTTIEIICNILDLIGTLGSSFFEFCVVPEIMGKNGNIYG